MPTTSALWGEDGERWAAGSRLPDVSFAGYRRGEEPIPEPAVAASVTDYGAVGDGEADDTEAFVAAIEDVSDGAIHVPRGEYRITDVIRIQHSNVVLRGDGPDATTLVMETPLNDIEPDWGSTAHGRRTSNYSWSGGFIRVEGSYGTSDVAGVTANADRGDTEFTVAASHDLAAGDRVEIHQEDTEDQSLCRYLYAGDPGDIEDIGDGATTALVADVVDVDGPTVTIDRPLRTDLREEWSPTIRTFEPTVTEVGIEELGFSFPAEPYDGHFTELGYNPLAFDTVAHCWARNVHVHNGDNGPFVRGRFCTLEGWTFDADRESDEGGCVGHHGVYLQDDDNVYRDFEYRVQFIHDLSVAHCAGNVIADGTGVNLCFDHHRWIPYANVYTNIDATGLRELLPDEADLGRLWSSSGGRQRGRHCASWGTFWNVRSAVQISPPPEGWGSSYLNVVGVDTDQDADRTDPAGALWWEPIDPADLTPQNIHVAQRNARLE